MFYIQKNSSIGGAYPAPQSSYAEGLLVISEEFLEVFFQYNGFVSIGHDGTQVTAISPKTEEWEKWKASLPPDPEPEPETEPVTWNALAESYKKGVESIG